MTHPKTSQVAFFVNKDSIYERVFRIDYFPGFSLVQKQKIINALHEEVQKEGHYHILEVSTKSMDKLGIELSAFNLEVAIEGQKYPIECIYQASKAFNNEVSYPECLLMSPLEAKRYIKEKVQASHMNLTHFNCFGRMLPSIPYSLFYDYLYLLGLSQNPRLSNGITQFDCFTDIEFNFKNQFASQARSCAIFRHLSLCNLVKDAVEDFQVLVNVHKRIIKEQEVLMLNDDTQ